MIRHAKNPVKPNTESTDEIIRNQEENGSEETAVNPAGSKAIRADEMENELAKQEVLVEPDIVPTARPVPRQFLPEREMQLKNRIISARMVLLFIAVLLAIAILLPLIPHSAEEADNEEKRTGWPELSYDDYFSGNYTASITRCYNNLASGHNILNTASTGIRSLFGPGDAEIPQDAEIAVMEGSSPALIAEEDITDYYDIVQSRNYHTDNPDVKDYGEYLVVRQDGHWKALRLYSGGDISLYAGTINYIRQMLDESVNIYVMPVPVSTQFYLPSNYEDRSTDMKDSFRRLSIQLISGIHDIDIIDVLNNHNMEPIYLRTEDHWAPLAAYYAAREFARIADVPFSTLDTYSSIRREDYLGSIYELTGSSEILNDPEDYVYYIPENRYNAAYYDTDYHYQYSSGLFHDMPLSDSYHVVLGKEDQIVKIRTDAGNGRKLLVIKDSCGNNIVPFLTGSFEEIYVADQEYFNFNLINFANYTRITDLLFINDYDSLFGAQAEMLEYITYSNLDAGITDDAPALHLPETGNPDINEEE